MAAMNESQGKVSLVSINLQVLSTGQRGRVFTQTSELTDMDIGALASELERRFVEEDDKARLVLLQKALALPEVTVQTYPGETSPAELHAYVRAAGVSDTPIFACVLATTAVVEHLLAQRPHIVFETASFQEIGDQASPSAIVAGMGAWARRVWPRTTMPKIKLSEWPELELQILVPQTRIQLSSAPMREAPPALTLSDYPNVEELHGP